MRDVLNATDTKPDTLSEIVSKLPTNFTKLHTLHLVRQQEREDSDRLLAIATVIADQLDWAWILDTYGEEVMISFAKTINLPVFDDKLKRQIKIFKEGRLCR